MNKDDSDLDLLVAGLRAEGVRPTEKAIRELDVAVNDLVEILADYVAYSRERLDARRDFISTLRYMLRYRERIADLRGSGKDATAVPRSQPGSS